MGALKLIAYATAAVMFSVAMFISVITLWAIVGVIIPLVKLVINL